MLLKFQVLVSALKGIYDNQYVELTLYRLALRIGVSSATSLCTICFLFCSVLARFFYSQFWNENGQNVKCARFSIPHSYSGMDRMPFQPFCSQGQNEQNAANAFRNNHSYSRMVDKKRALILITCLHIQDLASIYTRLSIRETPKLFHKTER